MKKLFEMPEIEVVRFETEEILVEFPSWTPDGDDLGWQ